MAKKGKSQLVVESLDENIINRMHDLIYQKCYNQKSLFKIVKDEYGLTKNHMQFLFKKLSEQMKENSNELLNAANEKIMTVLFELVDDENAVIRLKAIEMIMRLMQVNVQNINTSAMNIETTEFKFVEVVEPEPINIDDPKND